MGGHMSADELAGTIGTSSIEPVYVTASGSPTEAGNFAPVKLHTIDPRSPTSPTGSAANAHEATSKVTITVKSKRFMARLNPCPRISWFAGASLFLLTRFNSRSRRRTNGKGETRIGV